MATDNKGFSVLVAGGAGAFGARVAELLITSGGVEIVLAGRTRASLEAEANALHRRLGHRVRTAVLDAEGVSARDLVRLGVALVINASGPFQTGSYRLARAAVEAGCHSIDLADARGFVTGIVELDAAAREKNVLVVSGASSVPGLSSAVVAHHRGAFRALDEIDIAISPGNSFDPGVATVRSVLGGVGQPIRLLRDGAWQTVHGWQGLRRETFADLGRRWVGYVDVPDLDLFPANDGDLRTVRFQAGLEVSLFHLGVWCASWLVRSGLVPSLAPLAPSLLAAKRRLRWLGTDRGGMIVKMAGTGPDGAPKRLRWSLVALSGHGPYVPALASVAIAKRLASGAETRRGAMACFAVAPLDDILAHARGLDIACHVSETPPQQF